MRYIFLILFILPCKVHAQTFTMSERCVLAYQSFMAMKVELGKNYLNQEMKSNPKNTLPYVLSNYAEFISLVFNENPEEYKKKKSLKDKRLSLLEHADKSSPYYLFSKGLLYFQWSMIEIKYTDYWDAAWDFRKSFMLFKENKNKFPNFSYNNIYVGSQETVISTIPKGYKWISSILGLKGNLRSGMSTLETMIKANELPFKEEAFLYYIYLKNYIENDSKGAEQIISNYKLDLKNNQLFCFMAANLALNNKNAAKTEDILMHRNKSNEYVPFPMLEYELGDALSRRLDENAIQHYQQFLNTSKSNFYLKDACLNIAYCYYLQGDLTHANQYKEKIKSIGGTESDADQFAQKFAESGYFPDKEILKARMLNDGGYNEKALKVLGQINRASLKSSSDKLELIYRYARVYEEMNMDDKAIEYYKQTIVEGEHSKEYFASRAALQTACIYEKRGNNELALYYFNKVLSMDNHAYKNSIDQRAKSGINRINGK